MTKEKTKAITIFSGMLWLLVVFGIIVILTDYNLAKSGKEPVFCIKYEVKGNTSVCTGFAYKYYSTVTNGYTSKKFVPIWKNENE